MEELIRKIISPEIRIGCRKWKRLLREKLTCDEEFNLFEIAVTGVCKAINLTTEALKKLRSFTEWYVKRNILCDRLQLFLTNFTRNQIEDGKKECFSAELIRLYVESKKALRYDMEVLLQKHYPEIWEKYAYKSVAPVADTNDFKLLRAGS